MKDVSARILPALFLIAVAVAPFGCRTPKISDEGRGIPEAHVRQTGEMDIDLQAPGPTDWEPGLDKPFGEGEIGPDGLRPNEKRWEGVAVYFGYNRATVGVSEQHKVEQLGKHLLANPRYYAIIEGHCDDRGSDGYNRALGERRALAVHDFLITLGVPADRVKTISYGEERPAVPDATAEEQHARNRRAEFILGIQ